MYEARTGFVLAQIQVLKRALSTLIPCQNLSCTQKCSVTTSTGLEKVRVEILSQNCTLLHDFKKGKEGKERKGTLFKCLVILVLEH